MPHEVGVREASVEETGDSHLTSQGTDPEQTEDSKICVDGAYKKRVMDDLGKFALQIFKIFTF